MKHKSIPVCWTVKWIEIGCSSSCYPMSIVRRRADLPLGSSSYSPKSRSSNIWHLFLSLCSCNEFTFQILKLLTGWLLISVFLLAQWLMCCATIRKVAGSIPTGVSGNVIDIKSLRSHYDPGVDSASNRNEYQEYFLGGKGGRCVWLTTYHHPALLSRKSGNLNFLEPSGPVQACKGNALPCSTEGNNVFRFW